VVLKVEARESTQSYFVTNWKPDLSMSKAKKRSIGLQAQPRHVTRSGLPLQTWGSSMIRAAQPSAGRRGQLFPPGASYSGFAANTATEDDDGCEARP
jgi:hypothetical protein